MTPLYAAISKYFDSESALKATKASFDEGLIRLGKTPSTASAKDIEKVLKSNVYKQLQVALPPASAKIAVQKILDELTKLEKQHGSEAPAPKDPLLDRQIEALGGLEQGLKRFALYFDWAEVSKFRSQINVIKEQQTANRTVPELVRDAQTQLGALERKLQDLLVRQAQEVAELQGGFEKVRSMGGPKIKRLEGLITQIVEAQETQTLASAEVERARKLVMELRKLIESSVVQVPSIIVPPKAPTIVPTSVSQISLAPVDIDDGAIIIEDNTSPAAPAADSSADAVVEVEGLDDGLNIDLDFPELELTPEQSERVKDIELAEDARILEALGSEFAALLDLNPVRKQQFLTLQQQNLARVVQAQTIRELRPELEADFTVVLQLQQQNLSHYSAQLAKFAVEGIDTNEANVTASVASGMLAGKALAGDELQKIEDLLRSYERQLEELRLAKIEETARVERVLGRQASLLDELRGALVTFEPLGATAIAKLSQHLTELEMATQLRQPREDLTKSLSDEVTQLQITLEAWQTERQAEAERLAEEQRQLEAQRRLAEETRLAAERLEQQRRDQERMQAMERAEAQRLEAERLETERLAALERERQRLETERLEAAKRETDRLEAERRGLVAREGGMLRAMRLSLAALPDLPELATDHASLEAQLGVSSRQLEQGVPITSNLENFKLNLESLGRRAREVYLQRIADLERRANELGALEVIHTLSTAKEGLEVGNFPDLAHLEADLRAHREARLAAQRRELTDLEGGVKEFIGNPQSVKLQTQIAEARGRHEAGMLLGLAPLWDELEALRISEETAVNAWRTRAETVMREVNQYRQMGGETIRQLLRLSTVLATEPGTRLAPETRLKLERTLEEAERLLQVARQEAEAANAVAAALRDTGQIDDLLGIFGGDMNIVRQAAAEAKLTPVEEPRAEQVVMTVASSGSTANLATAWISDAQAALITAKGELQAGSIHEPAKIATLLIEMDKYQRELAKELERRPARICTVEQTGGTLLAMFLAGEHETKHFITVQIEDVAVMSRIFANAQRDFETLKNWSQTT
jgi:hypothetical protein